MKRYSTALLSRTCLLSFMGLLTALVLFIPASPTHADYCLPDDHPGLCIDYYADPARTQFVCEICCGSSYCDPTPYHRTSVICCPSGGS